MNKIKAMIKDLPSKAKTFAKDTKTYWRIPREGEYVTNREFFYLVLGISGNHSFTTFLGYIFFAATCLLVGSIYGLAHKDIYFIGLIGMPLGYLMTPINMLITDNLGDLPKKSSKLVNAVCIPMLVVGILLYFIPQHYFEHLMPALPQIVATILSSSAFNVYFRIFVLKKLSKRFGKYRSWIVAGALPTVITLMLIIYIPFEKNTMPYYTKFWLLHLLFTYFGIFNAFSSQAGNLQNVISPSTEERTKIMSYGSFLWSAIPSVVGILLPIVASLTGGFNDIRTYRAIFLPFMAFFAGLTMVLAFRVEDKIIIQKDHKPKISFKEGTKAVMKNKYFWITNLSNLTGCITGGSVAVINIFFIYATRQDWMIGLYSAIVGNAYVPGMLLAPMIIRRIGKRNLVIASKVMNIVTLVGSFFAIKTSNTFLFIAVNYIGTLINSPAGIAHQAMGADMWDYQQYLTGERLDGFSGIFALILNPISILGGYLIPVLYGLVGFTSDWDIMYVPSLRSTVVLITMFVGIVASIGAIIPFLFYDLTEDKHREIIEVLKERAKEKEEEKEKSLALEEQEILA